MDQMQVPCLLKKKWDLRERQRSNRRRRNRSRRRPRPRRCFAECEGQCTDTLRTPTLRSQGIEDKDDDEYEDETLMSVSLLLGSGVFGILFIFIGYLLLLSG